MPLKIIFAVLASWIGIEVHAQNYVAYQQVINRVDNDVMRGKPDSAAQRMDSLYQVYPFIYASHCIKGLQIAVSLGDERRAALWLMKSFVQGIPLWVIRSNELTKKALDIPACQSIASQYDSLHTVHLSRIDTALAQRIRKLIDRDALRTRRINDGFFMLRYTVYAMQWLHNNTKEVKELQQIIRRYGYPEEKIVGLSLAVNDSARHELFLKRAGTDLAIRNREAFFMFLHYFSTKRADLNDLLLPQVAIGNMPPYQYARINDYLSINTSSKKYPRYYEFGQMKDTTGLAEVNTRRAAIGLASYEQQLKQDELNFGYLKARRLNKEIILD